MCPRTSPLPNECASSISVRMNERQGQNSRPCEPWFEVSSTSAMNDVDAIRHRIHPTVTSVVRQADSIVIGLLSGDVPQNVGSIASSYIA